MNTNTSTAKENSKQDQATASHDEVAQRAYQLWEAAGTPFGRDMEYWLQAETEIRARQNSGSPEGSKREATQSAASPAAQPQREKSKNYNARATVPANSEGQRGQRMAFSNSRYGDSAVKESGSGN